jgi:hypothetical protein
MMNINNPELSAEHVSKLQKASPTANDILENLDSFNEEIHDLGPTEKLPEEGVLPTSVRPSRKKKESCCKIKAYKGSTEDGCSCKKARIKRRDNNEFR